MFGQVNSAGPMPGSRPTWYLTHEYVGRNQTCDLQKLQVAPLTVPLFLEGRVQLIGRMCEEAVLFRVASQLDHALPWTARRPSVHAAATPGADASGS